MLSMDNNRMGHEEKGKKNRRQGSISFKVSASLISVLAPFLLILITISCVMAAQSISSLNEKNLNAQTDYVVSVVDDIFSGKVTAVSMLEDNSRFQAYLLAVTRPEDIESYKQMKLLMDKLNNTLNLMKDENVYQVWITGPKIQKYLRADGTVVEARLGETGWYKDIQAANRTIVSEPYADPVTGERIVSIVSPVLSSTGTAILGYTGFDVKVSSLAEALSSVRVGEKGFLELISSQGEYIYSADADLIGKNVTDLDISQEYKSWVQENFNGMAQYSYNGISYKAMFRNSDSTGWLVTTNLPMSEVNFTRNQLITTMALLSVALMILLVFVIIYMIRKMMKPLAHISGSMEKFAQGDLGVSIQVESNDEIGRLADSVRRTMSALKDIIGDISHILREISEGNLSLTVSGSYMGDFYSIREALEHIIDSLGSTLGQINTSAEQVANSSHQVSSGAQSLSQGTTEQASSVEELAATINEISQQINVNAENAENANRKAEVVNSEAAESNERMQEMLTAMEDIAESSKKIGKIIKTIEDIAFQTNILALNAAVEAARAGAAGKGFAVVADEVRDLASKSAEASKDTTVLIETSLKAVENGTHIAGETAKSMEYVLEGVKEVAEIINGISFASNRQAQSVTQVTQGIEQISAVVQTNSATAQESAAACEELSSQAQLMKELISRFQIKE